MRLNRQMPVKSFTLAAAAGLLMAAAMAPAQVQISPTAVIVKVNGQPILGDQYFSRMQVLPDVGKLAGQNFVPASPGFLTLQQIINEMLIVQLAREQGVYPTDAELAAEVKLRREEQPQLTQVFLTLGLNDKAFEWDALVNMCQFRVMTKGVNITDMEVEQSYQNSLATRYTLPRRYLIRVISVTAQADQKKVDDALAGGKSFSEVALEMSQDEAKSSGGLLGEIAEQQLGGTLKTEIQNLKKGDKTNWVPVGQAWSKFFLEDMKEREVVPLDARLKRQIRRDLMIEKGQVRNNMPKLMDEMRKKAKLEFSGTPFDEALRRAFNGGE
jgi:parvulin-like peptidyl-prolyl isomerase